MRHHQICKRFCQKTKEIFQLNIKHGLGRKFTLTRFYGHNRVNRVGAAAATAGYAVVDVSHGLFEI